MRTRFLGAALAFCSVLSLGACSKPSEGYTNAQGSVGTSHDDALVFAADSDTDQVFVFDTVREQLLATIKVGASPDRVLVANDDTLFVTNRMGRSVSVVRRGDWKEAARIDVGVEPVSMALTGDGKTLYVVSSTSLESAEYGVLTAIDAQTLSVKWELPVGSEPRGLALLEGNRAMVSLFKDGDIALVDLSGPTMIRSGTDVLQKLNSSSLQATSNQGPSPTPRPDDFGGVGFFRPMTHPRGVEALTVSPDGRQVYAASRLSSNQVLPSTTESCGSNCSFPEKNFGGSGYGGGTCGAAAASAPALLTFDSDGVAIVDDVAACGSRQDADRPTLLLTSTDSTRPIQGPRAAVVDSTGAFVFVVNHDSNNVAIVPTSQQQTNLQRGEVARSSFGFGGIETNRIIDVGSGPTGIGLTRDGKRAWVYNSFDHSLSRIEGSDGVQRAVKTYELGKDVLPADVVAGRKLFFNANDPRMNSLGTGITCGTCHLDGREDGHVWNFFSGPRQTPTLAGRMLDKTLPLHWDGEFASMGTLSHTITGRMGGQGITPQMSNQISAYLASLPAADNPHRLAERTDAQRRGAQVFSKANCTSCHKNEQLTDNGFADVGTVRLDGEVRDDLKRLPKGFNTPSLLGLARSAPYLHDGSAPTLKARILKGKAGDLHGKTNQLTSAEVDDLVAYLQTL